MNDKTPETNQTMKFCFGTDDEFIRPKVAERLELERDQARAALAEILRFGTHEGSGFGYSCAMIAKKALEAK